MENYFKNVTQKKEICEKLKEKQTGQQESI